MDIHQASILLGFLPGDVISEDDIVKAYKAKAKITHPDMGGNDEDFRQVTLAYNVLREAVKRPAPPPRTNAFGKPMRCPKCSGTGTVEKRRGFRAMLIKCDQCKGTGASGINTI